MQPTSYFSLKRENKGYIFPVLNELPKDVLSQLETDKQYKSKQAMAYDMSWQAVYKGYIGDVKTIKGIERMPIHDEYVFIRKYFSKAWVLYVLGLRLCSFKNPIKEISCWIKTRHVKRTHFKKNSIEYKNWNVFKSQLVSQNPLITVVIPTLNRYNYLKDVLRDFEKQDYKNFEIVIVDQSDDFNIDFYKDFDLYLNVIQQKEKALWLARNTAVKSGKGNIIALSEDDVRINSDWLSTHLKSLDFFNADISAGVFYPEGKHIPEDRSFFTFASQFATGNAMLYKDVFKAIGLFDRQFEKQRMGDGEFGLRAYLKGFKSISNPKASCIDVKANEGGLRDMGSWDAFRTKKWFAPRPIPSVLYFFRRYFGHTAARFALLRTVPLSILPYQFKKNKVMLLIGAILSILILPVVFIQVYKSWQLSNKKLKEGPLIEELH